MNRRLFLRMMAGAAASLGLVKLPRAAKPDMLQDIPSKHKLALPLEGKVTEPRGGFLVPQEYVLYLDETCLELLPLSKGGKDWLAISGNPEHVNCLCSFKLPAADRGWHTIEFEEPTIDLVAMNAAERTLAAMLRERADLEEEV